MIYEWDPRKAELNERKHRIAFEEAATVFLDPFALVAHADVGEHRTRIIRARKVTRRERHGYQEARRSNG